MTIRIDEHACVGCLLCVKCCRKVFGLYDSTVVVKAGPLSAEEKDSCYDAVADCPAEAISLQM